MQSGQLRDRVKIQQDQGLIRSADGAKVPDWVILATVWADVNPLSDREVWFARQAESEITDTVRVRYQAALANLAGSVRVIFGCRLLHMVGVRDTDSRRRELVLDCTEAPDRLPYAAVLDPTGDEITEPTLAGIIEEP